MKDISDGTGPYSGFIAQLELMKVVSKQTTLHNHLISVSKQLISISTTELGSSCWLVWVTMEKIMNILTLSTETMSCFTDIEL